MRGRARHWVRSFPQLVRLWTITLTSACFPRLTKRKYLRRELGDGTLALMRTVKRALDPLGLLNPDKVLFPEGEEEYM